MKNIAVGIVVAVVWGYFSDLRNGEIGWFIGRLVFIPLFIYFGGKVAEKSTKGKK